GLASVAAFARRAQRQSVHLAMGRHADPVVLHGGRGTRLVGSGAHVGADGRPGERAFAGFLSLRYLLSAPGQAGCQTQGGRRPGRSGVMKESIQDVTVENSFADLPSDFYSRLAPQPLTEPRLLHVNADVAALLDLSP